MKKTRPAAARVPRVSLGGAEVVGNVVVVVVGDVVVVAPFNVVVCVDVVGVAVVNLSLLLWVFISIV